MPLPPVTKMKIMMANKATRDKMRQNKERPFKEEKIRLLFL